MSTEQFLNFFLRQMQKKKGLYNRSSDNMQQQQQQKLNKHFYFTPDLEIICYNNKYYKLKTKLIMVLATHNYA